MNKKSLSNTEPILVVPDVHLRIETLKRVLAAWGEQGEVIFLGDFFDDFDDTPSRNREMAEMLRDEILPNPLHTVLMGNHDLHYHPACPSELWCSGFYPDKKEVIGEVLGGDQFSLFKWAHSWDGVLFTHAGLHPRLVPALSGGGADELAEWIGRSCRTALDTRDSSEPLLRAGRMRGGYQPVGGVIWMDAREYQPISGLRQIFGHTPMRKAMDLDSRTDGSWCIDTNLDSVVVMRGGAHDVSIINTRGIDSKSLGEVGGRTFSKLDGGRGGGSKGQSSARANCTRSL